MADVFGLPPAFRALPSDAPVVVPIIEDAAEEAETAIVLPELPHNPAFVRCFNDWCLLQAFGASMGWLELLYA